MADTALERHWRKPKPLRKGTPGAIRTARCRANKYAAEVDAIRTIHGLAPGTPIGPVLREELWQHRYQGAGLSVVALASRFRSIAAEDGVPVADVAKRYAEEQIKPSRMAAGERLVDLVVEEGRSDWVDPKHLVEMKEPPENGTPNPAYVRVVKDLDGAEWVLVTSYDGSEPMAFNHDPAGEKAAMWEGLQRVQAVSENPTAYDAWLTENGLNPGSTWEPYTQSMDDGDFLAHSDGMHLV